MSNRLAAPPTAPSPSLPPHVRPLAHQLPSSANGSNVLHLHPNSDKEWRSHRQRKTPSSPTHPPAEPMRSPNSSGDIDSLSTEELIRASTSTDLTLTNASFLSAIIDSTRKEDSADDIFKILFRLPISKNPVVAFKAITLLHRLVAEAPAKLTMLCVEHDGFLRWVESSWSRERIHNKGGRVHEYTYGFGNGEISWYASLIRNRCDALVSLSSAFTAHWMIRPGALEAISSRRREAFRLVLRVLETATALLRGVIPARDPTGDVKRAAVPYLVLEVCKLYFVLCWIYCVAPNENARAELIKELFVAHNATRTTIMTVREDDQLVSVCHPGVSLFFDMPESVPTSFSQDELISSLKTLQKKKKKRKAIITSNSQSPPSPLVQSSTLHPRNENSSQSSPSSPTRPKAMPNHGGPKEAIMKADNPHSLPAPPHTTALMPAHSNARRQYPAPVKPFPVRRKVGPTVGKKNGTTKPLAKSPNSDEEHQGSPKEVLAPAPVKPSPGRRKVTTTGVKKNGTTAPSAKSQTPSEEHQGGSKEALAAALQGRKTPNMNPRYEIVPYEVQYGPQIGSGGFGVVYKAKFRNETVAVKKIHGHALSNASSVGEFQSEVAVLCTLNHPNILRFIGACTKPPNLLILTEFMGRGTLFDLLHQSQERVTWPMRRKFALDTCRGMQYLHDSKLLHRDLKSSNLMIDKDYNCKVGDFGLTRISKGAAAMQMTGQCGTFQYMAVEVLASKPYSEKADVFSFGILLWEMVARKLPYFGMQPVQVGIAVVQQGLRPTIPPATPRPIANMMRACWDNQPDKRPSFAQLVKALESMPE